MSAKFPRSKKVLRTTEGHESHLVILVKVHDFRNQAIGEIRSSHHGQHKHRKNYVVKINFDGEKMAIIDIAIVPSDMALTNKVFFFVYE